MGTFTKPVAIESLGDNILVLDSAKNSIMVFTATEYGNCINKAVGFRYDGNETESVSYWNKVLELDTNNELANLGLGKAYLASGDNEIAMSYFQKAKNRHYYSISYKRFRNDLLKRNLRYWFTGAAVIALGYLLLRKGTKMWRVRYERKG
jgi:tetratricopeptide (TPR) repeat protein